MTTVLSLIQQATAEMGITVPTYVAGNSSLDTVQQLALLNAVGNDLLREFIWEAICKEYRFTTQFLTTIGTITNGSSVITGIPSTSVLDTTYMVIGTGINQDTYIQSVDSPTQVTLTQNASADGTAIDLNFCKTKYSYPSDFDRPIDRTQWDKSKHWEMLGPETPQQWQWLKSGYISTGPRLRFRPMGGYFQIWPAASTAEYLGFEYISKNWVYDVSNIGKTSFTVDTDTSIFPDRLLVTGLKLKYFSIKGFDTTDFSKDYDRQLDISKANDSGSPTLSFAPRMSNVLISWDNIPDSGYGN